MTIVDILAQRKGDGRHIMLSAHLNLHAYISGTEYTIYKEMQAVELCFHYVMTT